MGLYTRLSWSTWIKRLDHSYSILNLARTTFLRDPPTAIRFSDSATSYSHRSNILTIPDTQGDLLTLADIPISESASPCLMTRT